MNMTKFRKYHWIIRNNKSIQFYNSIVSLVQCWTPRGTWLANLWTSSMKARVYNVQAFTFFKIKLSHGNWQWTLCIIVSNIDFIKTQRFYFHWLTSNFEKWIHFSKLQILSFHIQILFYVWLFVLSQIRK